MDCYKPIPNVESHLIVCIHFQQEFWRGGIIFPLAISVAHSQKDKAQIKREIAAMTSFLYYLLPRISQVIDFPIQWDISENRKHTIFKESTSMVDCDSDEFSYTWCSKAVKSFSSFFLWNIAVFLSSSHYYNIQTNSSIQVHGYVFTLPANEGPHLTSLVRIYVQLEGVFFCRDHRALRSPSNQLCGNPACSI